MSQVPTIVEKRDLLPNNFKNICSIGSRAVTKITDFQTFRISGDLKKRLVNNKLNTNLKYMIICSVKIAV